MTETEGSWVLCEAIDVHRLDSTPIRRLRPIVFESEKGGHVPVWSTLEEAIQAAGTLKAQARAQGRVIVCELHSRAMVKAGTPSVTNVGDL